MKVTKKAINAVLPSLTYFRRNYIYRGFSGIPPSNARTLMAVIFRVNDDGTLHETDYAYGDGWSIEDYNASCYVDAGEIIEQWMTDYDTDRKEVIRLIQEMFEELESPE